MARQLVFVFSLASYGLFLAAFLIGIAFVGDLGSMFGLTIVPWNIDSGESSGVAATVAIDLALIAAFGVHHSVAARPAFKRTLTQWLPQPAERSLYVLTSTAMLLLIFWQWRPLPHVLWVVTAGWGRALVWLAFGSSWVLVLASSFAINHFDFLGVRQAYLYLRGKPYSDLPFSGRGLYGVVRHPLVLGLLLGFWITPVMTVGHLLFAATMTAYGLVGIRFEERALVAHFGDRYRDYQRRVPGLLPLPRPSSSA